MPFFLGRLLFLFFNGGLPTIWGFQINEDSSTRERGVFSRLLEVESEIGRACQVRDLRHWEILRKVSKSCEVPEQNDEENNVRWILITGFD